MINGTRSGNLRYQGKVAIVTGAGSGIGRATAQRLAAEGAQVAVVDVDENLAAETLESIGDAAAAFTADVSDRDSVTAMARSAVEAFGGIDVLHANAGVPQPIVPFEELSLETWHRVIDVNLLGVLLCAQAVTPSMRARGGGAIVVTSSAASERPRPGMIAYIASKAGVNGLIKALAIELAPSRIRVNGVLPGPSRTPFLTSMAGSDEEALTQLAQALPLGTVLEPEDVAAAVAFLASGDASNVTGALLDVDGGRHL